LTAKKRGGSMQSKRAFGKKAEKGGESGGNGGRGKTPNETIRKKKGLQWGGGGLAVHASKKEIG